MTVNEPLHPAPDAAASAEREEWRGLKRDVEGIADEAAERGRTLLDAARLQAQDFAEGRKAEAARQIQGVATSVRDSGKSFEDRPNIKAFFDSAADGLDQLGGSIENRSLSQLYGEAEGFARRAPVAVAVGTFIAGFVAARFIKSSGSASDLPAAPRGEGI